VNTVDAVKQVLLRSGASWVLWLLGASLIATVVITVERWLFYRTREGDLQALARRLGAHLAGRDFDAAAKELGRSRSVAAAIAAAGLKLAAGGPAAADKAMQSAAALERRGLERWLAYLGTLGNNAPFVGLFGTVIGIIGAFEELSRAHGPGAGAAGPGQVASQMVMASVAEALVATAAGILVALPAVVAFNYFQRRVASLLAGTEVLSNLVLAYLSHAPGPTV
jgi:biopolymer transport protein ExbB